MPGVTGGVKIASTPPARPSGPRQGGHGVTRAGGRFAGPTGTAGGKWEVLAVADIAYVLLLLGGFLVLALTLRGLERL